MNIQIEDKICISCKIEKAIKKQSYCLKCMREKHKKYYNDRYKANPYKGFIYVVTNPAWNNWVKIGRAINIKERIKNYNVSSPYRDFKVDFFMQIGNPVLIERYFFEKYGTEYNEWFNISIDEAINELKKLKNEDTNRG